MDADAAARLIERLLTEPALRDRFRRDPERACREAGFDGLADELAADAGKAAYTLDLRESKSSLAGVLMAAAVEGFAIWELVDHAGEAADAARDVLSRVSLPAIPHDLALPGDGGGAAAGAVAPVVDPDAAGGAEVAAGGGAGGGGAASAAGAAGADAAASSGADAGGGASATSGDADEAADAAKATRAAAGDAPADPPAPPPDAPDAPAPAAASEPPADATKPPTDAAAPPATAPPADAAPAPAAAPAISPTVVAQLQAASGGQEITARAVIGRPGVVEVTAVGGQPVGEANLAARDLAARLGELGEGQGPVSIATPWALGGAGFVQSPGAEDRLVIDFGASGGAADTLSLPAIHAEPAARGSGANDSLVLKVPAHEPQAQRAAVAAPADHPSGVALDGGPTSYPGDDAPREQIAAWMGAEAQKRGLPPELPVMASLVESGMKNLNYGDADSVGFFQMRVGIWNKGAYAGFPEDPELQLKWFLDTAASVKRSRLANHQPIDDPRQFGNWVADVERPAEQYRGRYQQRLEEAQQLLRRAGAAGGEAPSARAGVQAVDPAPAPAAAAAAATPAVEVHPSGDAHAGHGAVEAAGSAGGMSAHELAKAAGQAALDNPKLHFDESGVGDLKAGRIDPRLIAVLMRLSKEHEITVSCMQSDHSKFTAGGSISNHFHGRGIDIATVDGQIVNAGSDAARTVAEHLGDLPEGIRPTEIGTPWALAGPGYFTDAGHQDHLHVGFDDPLPAGWDPPADLLPGGSAGAAAGDPVAARAGLASAGAAAPRDTLSLPAVAERSAAPSANDTLSLRVPRPGEAAAPAAGGSGAVLGSAAPAGAAASDAPAVRIAAAADAAGGAAPGGGGGAGAKALGAVAEAKKYLGMPYLWGGSSPKTGFDCSGLVQWAYAKQGIRIPRVTYDQIDAPGAKHIDRQHLLPGDLVFFQTPSGDVHHVGMSLGGDKFIHAPSTGDVVKISSLKEPYFAGQFAGGRRFDAAVSGAPAAGGGQAPPAVQIEPAAAPSAGEAGPASSEVSGAAADPVAVRQAEEARIVDERAARSPDSLIFKALTRQEAVHHRSTVQFLKAVRPEEAQRVQTAAADAGVPTELAAASPDGWPGNDAPREEIARWLGAQAQRHGLPPELPVMASLVESGMKNLNFGDADSVGLFQMRVGIWDKGAYAGFQDRPSLQVRWFIDQALAVKRARLAAGDRSFGRDPSQWGNWIADVERPAEQYRGRYQLRLAEARRLLRG